MSHPQSRSADANAPVPALSSSALPYIIHDLRTPLNVIGLSLRLLEQGLAEQSDDVKEDLGIIRDNVAQIERMLSHLGDYSQLLTEPAPPRGLPFQPRQLIEEVVEEKVQNGRLDMPSIPIDVQEGCPDQVELDPLLARRAIQNALTNALAAATQPSVRIVLKGSPQQWRIEVRVEEPPPPSLQSATLQVGDFERLFGTTAERRSLELAIVARVSELFGGSAQLQVQPGRSSSIVLDWPRHLAT